MGAERASVALAPGTGKPFPSFLNHSICSLDCVYLWGLAGMPLNMSVIEFLNILVNGSLEPNLIWFKTSKLFWHSLCHRKAAEQSPSHSFTLLSQRSVLRGGCYFPHIIEKEAEIRRAWLFMQNQGAWPDQDSYPILSDSEVNTLSLVGVKGRRRKLKRREASPHSDPLQFFSVTNWEMPGTASVKTSVLIPRTHTKLDTIACTSIGKWEVKTREAQGACEARSFIEKRGSHSGVSGVQCEHLLGSVMASSKKIDNSQVQRKETHRARRWRGKGIEG